MTITPAEQYHDLVELVREGYLPLETEARNLAFANGFPSLPLDDALSEAYRSLFEAYVTEISLGRAAFVHRAYEIAATYGLPLQQLDAALERHGFER